MTASDNIFTQQTCRWTRRHNWIAVVLVVVISSLSNVAKDTMSHQELLFLNACIVSSWNILYKNHIKSYYKLSYTMYKVGTTFLRTHLIAFPFMTIFVINEKDFFPRKNVFVGLHFVLLHTSMYCTSIIWLRVLYLYCSNWRLCLKIFPRIFSWMYNLKQIISYTKQIIMSLVLYMYVVLK